MRVVADSLRRLCGGNSSPKENLRSGTCVWRAVHGVTGRLRSARNVEREWRGACSSDGEAAECGWRVRQRQRQRQRQRLNAKRPACQSNQLTDASQNSLAVAGLLRVCRAHVNLSRSIAHTLVERSAIMNFISAFVLCYVCVQVFFVAPAHYALHC